MYFPCELLYDIVKYIPLHEIVKVCISLCPSISKKELNSIILSRKSVEYLFDDISSNVPELLDIMNRSGTVLSGVHARNYFNVTNISHKDIYEFYCHNHPLSCIRFIEYLKYTGIHWIAKAYTLKDGPPSQRMFKLQGYHELPSGKRNYIFVYWPMISNVSAGPKSMLKLISKGQNIQTYTIWGSMAMLCSGYIPSPSRSYLVKFSTKDIFQHISMLPNSITLLEDNSIVYQLNAYEDELYTRIKGLAQNFQIINVVMAILPYTIRYMPKYMPIDSWNEILTAIVYNHKLTLYI